MTQQRAADCDVLDAYICPTMCSLVWSNVRLRYVRMVHTAFLVVHPKLCEQKALCLHSRVGKLPCFAKADHLLIDKLATEVLELE